MNSAALSEVSLPGDLAVLWCFLLFFLVLLAGGLPSALAAQDVTFSWRANPPQDNVIGYRLYYGPESRFDASGRLKAGFHYQEFIDFTEFERCDGADPLSCDALSTAEVQCEGLYGDTPRCTVSGLSGPLYFAMTAYNAQAESSYTRELQLQPPIAQASPSIPGTGRGTVSPAAVRALQQVYSLLLLKQ